MLAINFKRIFQENKELQLFKILSEINLSKNFKKDNLEDISIVNETPEYSSFETEK